MDTDASPTKTLITELGEQDRFWQMAFGKRPQAELYDLKKDPDCVENVANDQKYSASATVLRDKLFAELKKQNDPRLLGKVQCEAKETAVAFSSMRRCFPRDTAGCSTAHHYQWSVRKGCAGSPSWLNRFAHGK
jgi:hypothetical protein